ncbi:MAG TPA: tRNA (adenosine(37)-N6)-threonylcarbamoyltransferase complex ATPase subunit type 1 TsaE [Steroidobacteraceae bacterium]|nr:tRNA (adenosine(37)-N6)-threonylcarbamoyltransferase complex ATPase subunit type 1 TsaE [Steroidobacteraceae bacterium]
MSESPGAPALWQGRTRTAEQTEALGAALARAVPREAEDALIIYLVGELGAGKSTFARGFLQALGVSPPIKSPTYTLLEHHEIAGLVVLHLDLYRLSEAGELDTLGLRELAAPGHLWLIEWPQRGGGRLPAPDLEIALGVLPEAHSLRMQSRSSIGASWLKGAVALFPATT